MKRLYLFIFLCLVVSPAFIFKECSSPRRLEREDLLQKHILDNGLAVIIKKTDRVPLVAVRLVINTGSAGEGKFAGSGISHFVEHMLFKGTSSRGPGQIEKEIKSYGGRINASTSYDTTEVYMTVRKEYLGNALALLADMVFNPSFNKSEIEKERDVILNEIRMNRDEPSSRVSALLWENAYLIHPYKYPIIGYEEVFKNITRQDILEYHSISYTPANSVLAVVGNIELEDAIAAVREKFGYVGRGAVPQTVKSEEFPQLSTRRVESRLPQLGLCRLMLAFHSSAISSPDMYPLDLLAGALGTGESSRLYKRLVRDKKLAYSASAYNYTPRDPGLFIVSLTIAENKIEEAVKEVIMEIEKLKTSFLPKYELDKIKKETISDFIYSRESIEVQADNYASDYAFTGDYNFSKKYLEGVKKVKAFEIWKAANKYLEADNMTVAVLRPQEETAVSSVNKQPKEEQPVYPKLDIKKMTLANGSTLLLYEDDSLPIISMSIVFKGGVRAEDKADNGISHLFSNMLLQGTANHSAEWIASQVESRGIALTNFSGNNSFGLSLKCMKEDFDFSLSLVSEILNSADFPEKEIGLLKDIQLASIKAREDDIFATASKTLAATIFNVHPYGMPEFGTVESVKALKRKDLINYYRRFLVADNMVVAVFGDIGAAADGRRLASAFNCLKRGHMQRFEVPLEPEQNGPRQCIIRMPKEQTVLMMGYPGADINNPDKYVLDIINSILSREGGRLYMSVREKYGFSYTLGSFSVLGIEPGYNVLFVATSSARHLDNIRNIILAQLEALKKDGPSEEELGLAKKNLIGDYFHNLEVNSVMGFKAALDELYGLGYESVFEYPARIEAITSDDVMRVAGRYFTNSGLNEVEIFPLDEELTAAKVFK